MFGKGKIDIKLQRTDYAPGDIISGNVALTLNKPVKARELSISLIGEYGTTETIGQAHAPGAPRTLLVDARASMKDAIKHDYRTIEQKVRICDSRQQLDGDQEYAQGCEYHFEIKLREDTPTGPIRWYLLAKLDVPGGPDITRKLPITIG